MVGNQEADQQGVPGGPKRVARSPKLDWSKVFNERPDLSPPGYEEAVAATMIKVEGRKLRQSSKTEAVIKKPAKSRRKK